jgi:MFS superfamily sulfate permease-like transporter
MSFARQLPIPSSVQKEVDEYARRRIEKQNKKDMSASVPEVSRAPVINRLFTGLLTGLLSVLFAATFGGLVFSGDLSPYAGILHSRAARTDSALAILQDTGSSVPVYQLEGFIFFGTVNRMLERIRERAARDDVPLNSVILDFRNVRGLDSSAAMYFSRLPGLASRRGFDLAIAAVAPPLWTMLQREGVKQERRMKLLEPFTPKERRDETRRADTDRVFLFNTLDHALEWSENGLLDAANYDPTVTRRCNRHAVRNHDLRTLCQLRYEPGVRAG